LHSIRVGVPLSQMADRVCPSIFYDRNLASVNFKMLKAARVGKFKHLVDDQVAAVPAGTSIR
jgi:hypothetical protein